MESIKKRLQLDTTEILMLLGIVFLISSLMFTLGVMVGLGVTPPTAVGSNHQGGHATVVSEVTDKSVEEGEHPSRAPSSVGKVKEAPVSELKTAFRESKQRALVDIMLRDNQKSAPKSIEDVQAHFEANRDVSRKPAASSDTAVEPRPTRGVSKAPGAGSVKTLFERKPSSKEKFNPTPGNFTVQIASYASIDESEAKVLELRMAGYTDAYVHMVKTKKGETWYRVAVGSCLKEQWAKNQGERILKRKLATDFFVRQVD
jgi:cell division septation protein DedD